MFNSTFLEANEINICHKCNKKLSISSFTHCGITLKGTPSLVFSFECKNCGISGRWTVPLANTTRYQLLNLLSALFIDNDKDDVIILEKPGTKTVEDILSDNES